MKRNQTNKLKTWTDKLKEGESVTSIPKENIDSNKISFYNGDTSDSDSSSGCNKCLKDFAKQ